MKQNYMKTFLFVQTIMIVILLVMVANLLHIQNNPPVPEKFSPAQKTILAKYAYNE